jgi:uncharacterized membrane protein (DUF4010 family)
LHNLQVDAPEPYASFGLSLVVGLLLGLEREQSRKGDEGDGSFLGGARTYPLVALVGSLCVLLGRVAGVWIVVAGFLAVAALVAVSYADDVRQSKDRGITTEVSFLLTFLLGGLAATRDVIEPLPRKAIVVASLAVVTTLILSAKPALHGVVRRVSRDDLFATLKFLIVAVVVLPVLPDRPMGPFDVLNPFKIGLMVALIAGIGFIGYVAVRVLGAGRGLGVTGLLGGMVSSTAVTLSFADRARKDARMAPACAVPIVLASGVMFARILIEVAVVHRPLVAALALPMGAMAAGSAAAGTVLFLRSRRGHTSEGEVSFENPFELGSALKFGALFAAVLVISKAAEVYLGARGMYLAAVLAGTTDVDAITLSTANLARSGGIEEQVATTTIVLGAASNTLVKATMAAVIGRGALLKLVLPAFGVVIACGVAGLLAGRLAG